MKKTTWADIKALCKVTGFFYVSYNDDTGKLCLRCNNGWIQANRPAFAAMLIRSTKFN